MSFQEFVLAYLEQHGVWLEDQRNAILEAVKADSINASMVERWQHSTEDYDASIRAVIALSTKRVALEWIDANEPKAFYRPMFTGGLD